MYTNSSHSAQKKIISVQILHLDDKGYGPKGEHTRREWRKECFDKLKGNKDAFEAWQKDLVTVFNSRPIKDVSLAAKILYSDETELGEMDFLIVGCKPYALDFVAQKFEETLHVDSFNFLLDVYFCSSCFGVADFKQANFSNEARFNNAFFENEVFFQSANFLKIVSFDKSTFIKKADFSKSNFKDKVFFNESKFFNISTFENAIFDKESDFSNVLCCGSLDFSNAKLKNEFIINDAIFEKNVDFINTKFNGDSFFGGAVFHDIGNFQQSQFIKSDPNFRGCKIDNTRLEFSDKSHFPNGEKSEEAIRNISFLKRLSDEQGQTDQALNFNAMELRAKRLHVSATLTFKCITRLYEYFSDYGRSYARPLCLYFGLLVCTFALALCHAMVNSPKDCQGNQWKLLSDLARKEVPCSTSTLVHENDGKSQLNGYRAAFEYTLYRAAGILDFSDNDKSTDVVARRLFGQPIEPWWMRFFGIFKAIASTALLFLAALGLRNKYRIK